MSDKAREYGQTASMPVDQTDAGTASVATDVPPSDTAAHQDSSGWALLGTVPFLVIGLGAVITLGGLSLLGITDGSAYLFTPGALPASAYVGLAVRLVSFALIACALVFHKKQHVRLLSSAAALAVLLGTALLALQPGGASTLSVSSILAAVVQGAGLAVLTAQWMLFLSAYGTHKILGITVPALGIAAIVCVVCTLLSALSLPVMLICALCAGAVLWAVPADMCVLPAEAPLSSDHLLRYPGFSCLACICLGLLSAVLAGAASRFAGELLQTSTQMLVCALAFGVVAVLTTALMLHAREWQQRFWLPAFFLLFITLLACSMSAQAQVAAVSGLAYAALLAIPALRWLFIPRVLSQAGSPYQLICVVFSALTDGSLLLLLAAAAWTQAGTELPALYSSAALEALILVVVFAAGLIAYSGLSSYRISLTAHELSLDIQRARSEARRQQAPAMREAATAALYKDSTESLAAQDAGPAVGADAPSHAADTGSRQDQESGAGPGAPTFEQALDAIAARYELTSRELEIALLTARGNSSKHIADVLVISSSTVRFHQQNIYRKLDIHSRQEFINLVSALLNEAQEASTRRG